MRDIRCDVIQWRRNKFESGGHRSGAKVEGTDPPEKKIFGRAPPLFGSKSTISRFSEHFHAQPYVRSWGHVPPVPRGVGATDVINCCA